MIYGYKYQKHKIENFHVGMQYFFNYLLTHEPAVFDPKIMFTPGFKKVMDQSSDKFEALLIKLVTEYLKLTPKKKEKVKEAFNCNNRIEELCAKKLTPVKYTEFKSDFADTLKIFDEKLWNGFPHNNEGITLCGKVKNHFDYFTDEDFQKAFVCPFCGLKSLEPSGAKFRNAYDHYLPKSLYPFTSINFLNLIPICDSCNRRGEKGNKDILFRGTKRRTVFYPFDSTLKPNKVSTNIVPKQSFDPISKSTRLKMIKWDLEIEWDNKPDDRVQTWDEIFGIKRRYNENMKVYERIWLKDLIRDFKRSKVKKESFVAFRKEQLEDAKCGIDEKPMGLLRYTFLQFLFNQSTINHRLTLLIKTII